MHADNCRIDPAVLARAKELGWDAFFPFLTDGHIQEFESSATPAERTQLDEWFEVGEVFNARPARHILSTSLFWKNPNVLSPDLPEPTLELLENAKRLGLVSGRDPWTHYVLPLVRGAEKLASTWPAVTVRVYLAKDLAFLLPTLTKFCEVHLMRHSSIRHAPGVFWRLFALEDAPDLVTVMDSDMMERSAEILLRRSEALLSTSVATWRGLSGGETDAKFFTYRTLGAGLYGTRLRFPMRLLVKAFVWHCQRGTFRKTLELPGKGEIPHFGITWPGYGLDEWFLAVAMYPRMLPGGFITYAAKSSAPTLYPLDMAMVSAGNSLSQILPL